MTKTLIVLCFLSITSAFAKGGSIIHWQTYHRPPGIFKTGEFKNQGFVQKVLQLITAKLPNYEHREPTATLARTLLDMKHGKTVCHPALFKTKERQQYLHFSKAVLINPTHRVVARKNVLNAIVQNDAVDLTELLRLDKLRYGLIKGRSFTHNLDKTLVEYLDDDNFFEMSNTDIGLLFTMMAKSRIDVSIAYPSEISYFLEQHPKFKDRFELYPIAHTPEYSFGYIACSKNAWGRAVIQQVNRALEVLKPTAQYKLAMTTWWQSELDNPKFQLLYKNEFLHQ